jgi:hypothetical protein
VTWSISSEDSRTVACWGDGGVSDGVVAAA